MVISSASASNNEELGDIPSSDPKLMSLNANSLDFKDPDSKQNNSDDKLSVSHSGEEQNSEMIHALIPVGSSNVPVGIDLTISSSTSNDVQSLVALESSSQTNALSNKPQVQPNSLSVAPMPTSDQPAQDISSLDVCQSVHDDVQAILTKIETLGEQNDAHIGLMDEVRTMLEDACRLIEACTKTEVPPPPSCP